MQIHVVKSKIHRVKVTGADLNYIGSITIDEDLMDACGLWDGEKVLVVSNTSGARLETYTIAGKRGSGEICVNGAAAHLINVDEEIIIVGFELTDKAIEPKVIMPSERNRKFVRLKEVAGAIA